MLSAFLGRPLSLIAESDLNDPRLITTREARRLRADRPVERRLPPRAVRQPDRRHHRLLRRLRLPGRRSARCSRRASSTPAPTPASAAAATATGSTAGRRPGGWWSARTTTTRSATGPTGSGCRASSIHRPLQLAALVTLLSPFTPMIFMGEEWGARTPWHFFTSHPEPELADAVGQGPAGGVRRRWTGTPRRCPDPQDPQTFTGSKLDWSEPEQPEHAELLELYRRLLALRRHASRLHRPPLRHSVTPVPTTTSTAGADRDRRGGRRELRCRPR